MSVYKEGFYFLEVLMDQARKAGGKLPICKGDKPWAMVEQLVKMYGESEDRHMVKKSDGHVIVDQGLLLMDEWESGKEISFFIKYDAQTKETGLLSISIHQGPRSLPRFIKSKWPKLAAGA